MTKPTHAVGVSVLVTEEDRVLLGRRLNNTAAGMLSTPGGRVEMDEDLITCAIRETKEETSLELDKDSLRIVGWREHFRFNQHYFMCYVHAPKWSGEVQNTEPDRCCGWAWHSIMHIQSETTTEPMDILLSLFERPVDNLRTQIDELMLKLNRENTKTFELKALLRKTIVFMDHTAECDIESLKNKGLLLPPSCSCGLVSLAEQIDQATK